jgi:hypothetical protein
MRRSYLCSSRRARQHIRNAVKKPISDHGKSGTIQYSRYTIDVAQIRLDALAQRSDLKFGPARQVSAFSTPFAGPRAPWVEIREEGVISPGGILDSADSRCFVRGTIQRSAAPRPGD